MSSVFINKFSASRLNGSMKGMASLPQSGAYNQEAFRYLLESETKRSERSGYFCQILLVHRTNAQRVIVQMDSHIAKEVMAALSRSLRETDYIGWYRDGYIVGAVLTVLVQEPTAQVTSNPQKRLVEILQAELGVKETSCLKVRICQHHELEGIESGEGTFAEN
jgi:hypothetical protein